MVAMSSVFWISCALVVVAIAICSPTTVAISEFTSAGVASTTRHSSHAPAAIKRRLKRTTFMETTESSEERALTFPIPEMDSILSSLKSFPQTIYQQIQKWVWRLTRKSSDKMFQRLELNKLGPENQLKLFEDPRFMQWVTFVEKEYSNPKAATEAMFETLTKHYRKDAALADVLVAGTEISDTKVLAFDLFAIQLEKWLKARKNMKQVFTYLKLENLGNGLFENPRFELWLRFFGAHLLPEKAEAEAPELNVGLIFSFLRNHFEDDIALKDVLARGSEVDNKYVKSIALMLQQFSTWKESEKTADMLFTSLKLNKVGNELFQRPQFLLWMSFAELEHDDYRETVVDILSILEKHYGEDAKLADVLVAGTKIPDTKIAALNLLTVQLSKWLETGKSVKQVFTYLKLEELGDELFESQCFDLWLKHYGARSLPEIHTAGVSAREEATKLVNEAKKAAEATQTANKADKPALRELEVLAVKKADAAKKKVDEINRAFHKAYLPFVKDLFFFLQTIYKDDELLRKAITKGLTVDNENVKEHAEELLKILDKNTPRRSWFSHLSSLTKQGFRSS